MQTPRSGPGGDDFDLSTLETPLDWIQFVRIIDADAPPNPFKTSPTAGFDLDTAVGPH